MKFRQSNIDAYYYAMPEPSDWDRLTPALKERVIEVVRGQEAMSALTKSDIVLDAEDYLALKGKAYRLAERVLSKVRAVNIRPYVIIDDMTVKFGVDGVRGGLWKAIKDALGVPSDYILDGPFGDCERWLPQMFGL